ncbi:MAG TPA: HAD family acid phosphatase [Solirubrobacterales bacterium]|nr:HAD family acid phosphatase [Solirubrobacterales bacterium]
MRRRTLDYLLLALVATGLIAAGYAVAGGGDGDGKTKIATIRPTGVGLPRIGMHGTVGAGDLPAELVRYHDSGRYESDLDKVGSKAQAYLDRRVAKLSRRAEKRCARHKAKPCRKPKLAMVLDIDETSLSNYEDLADNGFSDASAALATSLFAADAPAIDATLELFEDARDLRVSVFFITGRPDLSVVRERTEANLTAAGYSGWRELVLRPSDAHGTVPYKSGARDEIEDEGYRIVLNVGDQDSDLKGGHADKAYKLPNPYYFIGD